MQPDNASRDEIRAARREVRQGLGSAMADKASDEFCLTAYRRAQSNAFGAETTGVRSAPVASVVEFDGAPPAGPRLEEIAAALPAVPHSPVRLAAALRQAVVGARRQQGYQIVGRVYDEVERLSGGTLGLSPQVLGAPEVPSLVTQVCWLNRTMRTWAGPEVLADVVSDASVQSVDVPRRLMPDADVRNHAAVALPAYLRSHPMTGDGITVAVIDSEVVLSHPALAGRVVHRRNYTMESWGNPDSHGTAVAGIIAADDEVNGGLAPGAVIYNYKVLATNRFLNSDDFGGALAVQQALEDGADVANCSWGAGPITAGLSREARAVDAAWAAGLVVVKSAGNNGPGPSTMTTPADAAGVIVVGATDLDGAEVQDYSSRGPGGSKPGPDLLAPGGSLAAALACCLPTGGFGDAGMGTSYAAPHVSGLVALFLQEDPALLPDQLRERLRKHARPLTGITGADQGWGLAQAV
jgi:serine protease AprX